MRRHDPLMVFLAVLTGVAVISVALWAHFAAPCGLYKFSHTKDVPTRCLSHFTR